MIIANEQTAGRGRRGNSFYSPKDTGLYMTLVFEENGNSDLLTPAAAVAVCDALSAIGSDPKIKWVNDVFIGEKKVCGILTERVFSGGKSYIILGIGINISTCDFPDSLKMAGSINLDCNKENLADNIAEIFFGYNKDSKKSEIIEKYRSLLFIIGREVSYFRNNFEYRGTVLDINNQCNLILRLPNGETEILSSGEISIIL